MDNIAELCEIAFTIGRIKNSSEELMDGGYFEFESMEVAMQFYKSIHKKWVEYEGPIIFIGQFIYSLNIEMEFRNFNSTNLQVYENN